MYIRRISLKNIRCFDEINVDFASAGSSALFLGDNGDGKSTILRSLAMGLCDESSAAALFRELTGEFVRRPSDGSMASGKENGVIEIELVKQDGVLYRITTEIHSLPNFERVRQSIKRVNGKERSVSQGEFPWDEIFVVGYGPGLRTRGTMDYQHYLAVDSVYPLFRYDVPLQNPELIIRRLIDAVRVRAKSAEEKKKNEERIIGRIQLLMKDLLDLEKPEDFRLTPTGIIVNGFWGSASLNQLGDGFQATITWVIDLISWWFLRENGHNSPDLESIGGIVIIDEIEQHLHPRWQHRILPLLRDRFPRIQFIVATHSPLVASGCGDVEVHLFNKGQQSLVKPYGWLAENIYEMMGLKETRSTQFRQVILDRYSELHLKKSGGALTKDELAEMEGLDKYIMDLPEGDNIRFSIEMSNMMKMMKSSNSEEVGS